LVEAGRLKREIKKDLGLTPRMRFAGTGVLDVVVDGQTVFSYGAKQRLLEQGEIVKLIQASKPA
jgi:hypothetical protein